MKRSVALLLVLCMLASLTPIAISEDEITINVDDTAATVLDSDDSVLSDILDQDVDSEIETEEGLLDLPGIDLPKLQQEEAEEMADWDFVLYVNESYTLDTASLALRAEVPEGQAIEFSSSDPKIADVTPDGTIKALAVGEARISCLVGHDSIADYTVKVIEAPDGTTVAGPAEETPAEETPAEETPAEEAPAEETSAGETPAEETPAEKTPAEETPAEETSAEETPAEETPAEKTPAEETPAEETPAEKTPAEETPAEETPAEETPAEETPAEETPAEKTPAEETPAEETPAEETPAEETPAEETPAEETPAEETPAEETLAEETPAEETPAEKTPAEETPAEETPAEETPAEETPAEETPAGETPAEGTPAEETPTEGPADKPDNTSVADAPQPTETPESLIVPEETEETDDTSRTAASQGKVPSKLELGVKEKYTLNTKSLAKGKKITYKTSKKAVATVSDKGVITGVKAGTATITCYRGKTKVATCAVTVVKAPKKVTLKPKTVTLGVKETLALQPTLPAKTHASFTWSVKNKKIATVSKDGVVKGVKAGSTTVTVKTHNGKQATVTVKVLKAPGKVTLDKTSATLDVKQTLQLTAKLPSKTASQIKWTTSNAKVATVSDTGLVTGVAKGKATITATTFNGKKATCAVTVIGLTNQDAKDAAAALGISPEELAKLAGVDLETLNKMTPEEIQALEFTTDNVVWKLNDGNTGVIIVKYNGTKSSLTINDKYYSLAVTEIGESAFEGNDKLKSITLPATVTVIGKRAFRNCVNLSSMK